MATSTIHNNCVKITKEVTVPANGHIDVDLSNDIPNKSKMLGFTAGLSYTNHYYDLSIYNMVLDKARPLLYVSNKHSEAVTNEVIIVVFY